MADQTQPEAQGSKDQEFLRLARKRFERCVSDEKTNRDAALEDLRFKNGDQWPAKWKLQRDSEDRPCLTINTMKTFVHQVTNDQRANRPAINVSPIGNKGDKKTAEMLRGLIRHIERQSDAEIAYDTGFDAAASAGWGYWRVKNEYDRCDDQKTFDQVLTIKRVRNQFSVYLGPHQQPDGSDARYGFVTELVPREEFKERHPGKDPVPFDQVGTGDAIAGLWATDTDVRICEYYVIETKTRKLVALMDGFVGFEDELAGSVKQRIADDPTLVRDSRKADVTKVRWYLITAREILEQDDTPFDYWLPIVKCVGDEIDIEGKVSLSGIIRDAKDPARMKNYWSTKKTEAIALVPNAPYIMAEGQDEGHEDQWDNANRVTYPRLTYRPVTAGGAMAPPPQRQAFAGPPMGVIEAERDAEQDMMRTTGIRFDAAKSERVSDESGVALKHLRQNTDLGAYHYIDNFGRSLKHTARILINAAPKIYDMKRWETILREDGTEEAVLLDPSQTEPYKQVEHDGKRFKSFNLNVGKYSVTATVGPSYATKRLEASAQMIQFADVVEKALPIADLIAEMQDWPGSEKLVLRLQRMLAQQSPGLIEPEQDDMSPQVQAFIGSLKQKAQGLEQQLHQLAAALAEKQTEHEIAEHKIDRDFEARMQDIAAKMEIKMLDHIVSRMAATQQQVLGFEQQRAQQEQFEQTHALAQQQATQQAQQQQAAPAAP